MSVTVKFNGTDVWAKDVQPKQTDEDRQEPLCKQTGIQAHKNINFNYIISNQFYSAIVIKINLTHEHLGQF